MQEEPYDNKITLLYLQLKEIFKRIFKIPFKYKCINCGKGHDGNIYYVEDYNAYTNVRDFCSDKCFSDYVYKNGYSFKKKITDEATHCITCNKEHNNRIVNPNKKTVTSDFCSKDCFKKFEKKISQNLNGKNKKYFNNFVNSFKNGKYFSELKEDKNMEEFKLINIDKSKFNN